MKSIDNRIAIYQHKRVDAIADIFVALKNREHQKVTQAFIRYSSASDRLFELLDKRAARIVSREIDYSKGECYGNGNVRKKIG